MEKFQVFSVIGQAIRLTFSDFPQFLRASLVPALLLLLPAVAVGLLASRIGLGSLAFVLLECASALIIAPFLASWYRRVLGRPDPGPHHANWRPRSDDRRFYLYAFWFTAALACSMAAAGFIAGEVNWQAVLSGVQLDRADGEAKQAPVRFNASNSLLAVLLLVGVLLVVVRLCFVFPAAAIGKPIEIADSWTIANDHHVKIFFAVLITAVVFTLIRLLFAFTTGLAAVLVVTLEQALMKTTVFGVIAGFLAAWANNIAHILAAAANCAVVALMYQALTAPPNRASVVPVSERGPGGTSDE